MTVFIKLTMNLNQKCLHKDKHDRQSEWIVFEIQSTCGLKRTTQKRLSVPCLRLHRASGGVIEPDIFMDHTARREENQGLLGLADWIESI